jgi:hypothetical protein
LLKNYLKNILLYYKMKGVKYTLEFKKPNNEIETTTTDMKEICETIKKLSKEHYFIDVNVSKYVVYNIYKKRGGSKLLNSLCRIEKV